MGFMKFLDILDTVTTAVDTATKAFSGEANKASPLQTQAQQQSQGYSSSREVAVRSPSFSTQPTLPSSSQQYSAYTPKHVSGYSTQSPISTRSYVPPPQGKFEREDRSYKDARSGRDDRDSKFAWLEEVSTEDDRSVTKMVSIDKAFKALDELDDCARMDRGVNAIGPRSTLLEFIDQHDAYSQLMQEAYQVITVLSEECGRDEDSGVVKILENLYEGRLVHDDVLPFHRVRRATTWR